MIDNPTNKTDRGESSAARHEVSGRGYFSRLPLFARVLVSEAFLRLRSVVLGAWRPVSAAKVKPVEADVDDAAANPVSVALAVADQPAPGNLEAGVEHQKEETPSRPAPGGNVIPFPIALVDSPPIAFPPDWDSAARDDVEAAPSFSLSLSLSLPQPLWAEAVGSGEPKNQTKERAAPADDTPRGHRQFNRTPR